MVWLWSADWTEIRDIWVIDAIKKLTYIIDLSRFLHSQEEHFPIPVSNSCLFDSFFKHYAMRSYLNVKYKDSNFGSWVLEICHL